MTIRTVSDVTGKNGRARKATARKPAMDSQVAYYALVQTLRVLVAHFAQLGLPREMQRKALKDVLGRVRGPMQLPDPAAIAALHWRVELLATWHRQERYVGADGQPRPLPLIGTPSLQELFRRLAPSSDPQSLAFQLEAEGVIRKVAEARWLPVRRTLLVPTLSEGAIARLPLQVAGLLATLSHNAAAARRADRRLERTVYVDRLPARHLAEFDEFTKRLGTRIIDEVDNWLMRREVAPSSPEPAVRAGLSVFSVAGKPPPQRAKPPARTPKTSRRS